MMCFHRHGIENIQSEQFHLIFLGIFSATLVNLDLRQTTDAEDLAAPHVLEQIAHQKVRGCLDVSGVNTYYCVTVLKSTGGH